MVESQSRVNAIDKESLRHRDGHAVTAYWQPNGDIHVWVNDGPPKTHYVTDLDGYEYALATGQIG